MSLCPMTAAIWMRCTCYIKGLKSVHGSLKFEISRSSEAFAFTSAAYLPFMPTWLGSQQNKISLVFDNS